MLVRSRPAVLLATASLAVGLLAVPGAANAATVAATGTEEVTAEEVIAAMRTVASKSAAAEAKGWKSTDEWVESPADGEEVEGKGVTLADPATRRLTWHSADTAGNDLGGAVDAAKGEWMPVEEDWQKAVLTMMGKSSVKYVFTARKIGYDEYAEESPAAWAAGLADRVEYAAEMTKTTNRDGSAEYTVADEDSAVTLHVSAGLLVTGRDYRIQEGDDAFTWSAAFTYGAQTLTMPSAASTVDAKTLQAGRAYLDMAGVVKKVATTGAADTRAAAKGGKIQVASLRKLVRKAAAKVNGGLGTNVAVVKDIDAGVRVTATNPWTRKSAAWTVKASGKTVVVKQA